MTEKQADNMVARARLLEFSTYGLRGLPGDRRRFLPFGDSEWIEVTEAIDALAASVEQCCSDVCGRCAEGKALFRDAEYNTWSHEDEQPGVYQKHYLCGASAIRERRYQESLTPAKS